MTHKHTHRYSLDDYPRPREKLVQRGISSLSDRELIQLMIGSGTVRHPLSHISKKVLRLLSLYGSTVSYDQLVSIPGLGLARAAHIMAGFELSSRYPGPIRSPLLDSNNALVSLVRPGDPSIQHRWLVTLDGARRLIGQQLISAALTNIMTLRHITERMIADGASHAVVLRSTNKPQLTPDMSDLTLARDVYRVSLLLGLSSTDYLICNDHEHRSIMKEASYAA